MNARPIGMKSIHLICSIVAAATGALGATTINSVNKFAYGGNIGWLSAEADATNGAVIGEFVCSGFIYASNAGWISLADGMPIDGVRYQNNSAGDFGVNHDGRGNLQGLAYGANIGWIRFETNGAARVDLKTGRFSGSAWSANCGWISLSNAFAHVQTRFLQPSVDSDGDGIPDAWELTYTNSLTVFTASTDTDGDGTADVNEFLADTDPLDANDHLRITLFATMFGDGSETNTLTWTSRESRCYR